MSMNADQLDRVLGALGATLATRGLHYELVAIGGSGLMLLGVVSRATTDLDVVALVRDGAYVAAEPLPAPLSEAVEDVGRAFGLSAQWVNAGPTELLRFGLPDGFVERVQTRTFGGLKLHFAGRFDQVCFKVYAAADQGLLSKHVADLRALEPSSDELLAAARWSTTHDTSEGYRQELVSLLGSLGVEGADERL